MHKPFQLEDESEEAKRLNAVLQKSLAKQRDERFASAAEMASELIPAVRSYKAPSVAAPEKLEADTMIIDG